MNQISRPGKNLMFAHGFNSRYEYDQARPAAAWFHDRSKALATAFAKVFARRGGRNTRALAVAQGCQR